MREFIFAIIVISFSIILSDCSSKINLLSPELSNDEFESQLASLEPGDSLMLKEGIYPFDLFANIPSGKNWDQPIILKALEGHQVIFKPLKGSRAVHFGKFKGEAVHHIELNGIIFDAENVELDGIKITDGAHHIRVKNCEIKNAKNQGVLISNPLSTHNEFTNCRIHNNGTNDFKHGMYIASDNNLVKNSEIFNNAGAGINIYNGKGTANYNQVLSCNIHNNARAGERGAGIGMHCGDGNIARNNRVWQNNTGIHTDYGAANSIIEKNILFDNKGYDLIAGDRSSGCQLINNTIKKKEKTPEILIGKEALNPVILNNSILAEEAFVWSEQ